MKTDIYTLAHEIKNPLCVVKGYLEMLNKNNLENYKKIIKDEINSSIEILDDYLEFNKIIIQKDEMDLNLLLLDIKKSMKDYLKKKGINLSIQMIDDEIYLKADYNKLKQVIYNIIKNSVEAHSKNITVFYEMMFNKINISIVNDGEKINNNSINKIGSGFTNKVLGNGIGVNLSKKIINLHGGEILYENNKLNGISVIITLNIS